jgi:hypothetical protein
LIPVFKPEVAESVTVFNVPVVRPTVLFAAPVTAFAPWPITPGFLAAAGIGGFFWAEEGVGFVPSGFEALTGVFFAAVVLGFIGVALEVVPVLDFKGVEDVGAVAVAFDTGTAALLVSGPLLRETGRVFWVPRAVRGFEAALTVDLVVEVAVDGVDLLAAVGIVLPAVTGIFFAAGVVVVAAGVARVNFAGAFFTGVAPVFAAAGMDEAGVVFFTGVALGVVVVLEGVEVGFFATFSMPLTLAINEESVFEIRK